MATLKVMVASRYLQRDLVVVLVDSACWECAKSWNQQYTPVMQRWVRSMFIDDVAGYMVTYSKRKHVEKNLSQRR